MNPVKKYCNLLGVTPGASVKQLQKTYREKAKEIHPSGNITTEAQKKFIELTVAFEYLYSIKSGIASSAYYFDYWEESQQELINHATELSTMTLEEFLSWEYLRETPSGNFNPGFLRSIKIMTESGIFLVFISVLINGILLTYYMFNTEVSLLFVTSLISILYLAGLGLYKFNYINQKRIRKKIFYGFYTPLLFNLFFIMNFIFSSGTTTEKYEFGNYAEWVPGHRFYNPYNYSRPKGGKMQNTTFLLLPDNKYSDTPWLRLFFDYDAMKNRRFIEYEFAGGLFGLRVVKNYKFTN